MAQQMKTVSAAIDGDTLPEISDPERIFCEELLKGKNASDAYLCAYPDRERSSSSAVRSAACRLRQSATIRLWIRALTAAGFEETRCSLSAHLDKLAELRDEAQAAGNYGAAFQCEQARGKVMGHYVDRFQDVTKSSDPLQTLASNIHILGPEKAYEIATEKMGYSHEETVKGLELTPEQIQAAVKSKGNKSKGEAVSRELH